MNLTQAQFVEGVERAAKELPKMLDEREKIDDELWDEHVEQLNWMVEHIPEVYDDLEKKIEEVKDLKKRLTRAKVSLLRLEAKRGRLQIPISFASLKK